MEWHFIAISVAVDEDRNKTYVTFNDIEDQVFIFSTLKDCLISLAGIQHFLKGVMWLVYCLIVWVRI